MKKIRICFFIIAAILCFFMNPGFAADKNDTMITYLKINNEKYFDLEIVADNKGKVLLPIKEIADILEIEILVNHSTKEITFTSFSGKKVRVTKEDIFLGNQKINSSKNDFIKLGIMDSTKDEIFANAEVLSKIFESEILVNKNDMAVVVKTNKKLSYLTGNSDEETEEEETFKAHSEVLVPKQGRKISFDTLELNNSMNTDSVKQVYLSQTSSTAMFTNNSQFSLKGRAYEGDYSVDFNTNNYTDQIFSFGGLSFKYKNKFKKYDYELGKVTGFRNDAYFAATDLLGAQIFNYETKPIKFSDIDGKVGEKSLVNLYINDLFYSTLSTYGGNYSLKDVHLEKAPYRVRIEELKEDGSVQDVFEKSYAKNFKRKSSVLAGVSGINGRLFSQQGQIYQMTTKKFVVGANTEKDFGECFAYTSSILADKIMIQNPETIWGLSYFNNNSLLSGGTFQNPNVLEGVTVMNTYSYKLNENLKLNLVGSLSYAYNNSEQVYNSGYDIQMGTQYTKKNYTLFSSIYQQSPQFYLAGSEAGFASDRLGARIGGNYKGKNFGVNTSFSKYCSNLENENDAGLTGYNEFSLGAGGKIKNYADVRFNGNFKNGENTIGKNQSYYYDLGLVKDIKNKVKLELGQRESNYETTYAGFASRDFSSKHSTIYARSTIKMPKNTGSLMLGHDIVNYESNGTNNDYRMLRLGYNFPEYKRIIVSTGIGYKYQGLDKGNNYMLSVGYRTKSNSVISVNYQYGNDNGYLLDNMYIPSSLRHTVSITYNDTFAILPTGLKSVGYSNETKGFVETVAYFDRNKNKVYDLGDIGIPNVPIKTSWTSDTLYTGLDGVCRVDALDKGVYKVELDSQKLHTMLSGAKTTKESQLVVVSPQKTTHVDFAMTSSVGNISGKLNVVDDFGRVKDISEFIVVIHDENDKEVAYSTVDKSGNYIFSGIEPGKYTIKLDESFINENSLVNLNAKGDVEVEIPYAYKKFIDLKNVNLSYKGW